MLSTKCTALRNFSVYKPKEQEERNEFERIARKDAHFNEIKSTSMVYMVWKIEPELKVQPCDMCAEMETILSLNPTNFCSIPNSNSNSWTHSKHSFLNRFSVDNSRLLLLLLLFFFSLCRFCLIEIQNIILILHTVW